MDAWRYRDLDAGAFDRFWPSLVAEGAALGEGLRLTFEQVIAARGSRARFTVRDRRLEPRATIEASAVANCGTATHAIRLWPAGTAGEFVGEVPAAQQGECTVEATVDERRVTGSIAIVDRPARGTELTLAKLERQARASGGVVAKAGEERDGGPGDRAGPLRCLALSPFIRCASRGGCFRSPAVCPPSGGCAAATD